jgi:hypothetical protein
VGASSPRSPLVGPGVPADAAAGTVVVFVEVATVSALNRREHHFARRRRVARERQAVRDAFLDARVAALPPLPVDVVLVRHGRRRLDFDNGIASLKSVIDEISRILGVDDGDERRVRWFCGQERSARVGVRVEVRPRGAEVGPWR